MEHIVQFAVGVDDEAIKKTIKENAVNVILRDIRSDVEKDIFGKQWGSVDRKQLGSWASEVLTAIIQDNKEEIIERAARMLCDRIRNTKMYKEAMQEVLNDGRENTCS